MPLAKLDSRTLLRLTGSDKKDFLQNLVSNDLTPLSSEQVIYAALLTPQGKFLHDFIITERKDAVYLDCASDRKDDLIKRLTLYKLRADVAIEDVTDQSELYAFFGDATVPADLSIGQAEQREGCILYRDPRHEDLGFRIIGRKDSDWHGDFKNFETVDESSYLQHRLSLGIPEGGSDIVPEKNFLLEMNFEELNGVSFSKGCYVGQELTARTKHRAKIKKRLFSFTYDGTLSPGDSIRLEDREIATVSAFSAPHGLALTRLDGWQKLQSGHSSLEPAGLILIKPDYVILPEAED